MSPNKSLLNTVMPGWLWRGMTPLEGKQKMPICTNKYSHVHISLQMCDSFNMHGKLSRTVVSIVDISIPRKPRTCIGASKWFLECHRGQHVGNMTCWMLDEHLLLWYYLQDINGETNISKIEIQSFSLGVTWLAVSQGYEYPLESMDLWNMSAWKKIDWGDF